MKKLASLLLALVLVLSCCAALAEDEKYTCYFVKEDLAGATYHNGFVSAVEMESEKGTLYYKVMYVYTGTYTRDGDQVTLNVPTDCTFSEDWGSLSTAGYLINSEGTASKGDKVSDNDTEPHDPMANFSTQVYKFDESIVAVTITVNADGTFTYNAVASSDDD